MRVLLVTRADEAPQGAGNGPVTALDAKQPKSSIGIVDLGSVHRADTATPKRANWRLVGLR